MRPEAVTAMVPFLTECFGNPSGSHGAARAAKQALEEARETVADALGADPGDVVFTAGGTEADNLAVEGAARAARSAGGGDGIVTTAFEHKGVLAACDRLAREGFRVHRAAVDRAGIVDLDALGDALDAQTALTQLEQADANYAASVGTDAQAARAYSIAEVRFNEGISTQVELEQSRTQLEQARLNRVLAARDLEMARLRLAFLKDLPVGAR